MLRKDKIILAACFVIQLIVASLVWKFWKHDDIVLAVIPVASLLIGFVISFADTNIAKRWNVFLFIINLGLTCVGLASVFNWPVWLF